MPIVVCLPGGEENPWDLPSSRFDRKEPSVSGGMRTLLELAFAIASLDRNVEVRGSLPRTAFQELVDATGRQPRAGMESRAFSPDDLVLLPEGLAPRSFARYVFSPARVILVLLAPPGFIGWSMGRGWAPPDLLTISVDSVGRPEHFRAMAALGFELWTQSSGLAEAARAAGVECLDIGSGNPVPYPPPREKAFDVVYLEADKWAPLAREVTDGLGTTVLAIPWLPRADVLREISRGRLLVLPAIVEGRARVLIEARAMGTVPVALNTNRFAAGLSEGEGVALASSTAEMRKLIPELLADPNRLEELSARGRIAAPKLEDWESYRTRIHDALDLAPPPDPGREARAEIGQALRERVDQQLLKARKKLRYANRQLASLQARRSVRIALRSSAIVRRLRDTVRRPN